MTLRDGRNSIPSSTSSATLRKRTLAATSEINTRKADT